MLIIASKEYYRPHPYPSPWMGGEYKRKSPPSACGKCQLTALERTTHLKKLSIEIRTPKHPVIFPVYLSFVSAKVILIRLPRKLLEYYFCARAHFLIRINGKVKNAGALGLKTKTASTMTLKHLKPLNNILNYYEQVKYIVRFSRPALTFVEVAHARHNENELSFCPRLIATLSSGRCFCLFAVRRPWACCEVWADCRGKLRLSENRVKIAFELCRA